VDRAQQEPFLGALDQQLAGDLDELLPQVLGKDQPALLVNADSHAW
jgi:hypothetical protein